MSSPKLSKSGSIVTMDNGDLSIGFDENFGGAALHWKNSKGVQLVNPFPGEGCNVVFDTGNDGTQASADGLTPNYVGQLYETGSRWAYYLAETSIGRAWQGVDMAHYQASGILPFFWASLEKIDDSVPLDARGPMAWNTQYNNFLNLAPATFTSPGVPLIFAPRGPVTSGMILIGDEIKQFYSPGTPWNQAFTKIRGGRFAARFHVSVKEAGNDAIAGFIIRKDVPLGANANINDLYAAKGYQLNFNKVGGVQLVKDNAVVLWTSPKTYKNELNSTVGLIVELRTSYTDSTKMEIYLGGVLVTTITGLTYNYEAFGCFAQTTSGKIIFTYREVFDLNVVMTSAWFAYTDHFTSALGICALDIPLYRIAAPVIFVATPLRQMWEVKEPNGTVWNNTQNIPWQIAPGLLPVDHVKSIWIGQQSGSGIGALIEHCPIDGHIGIDINQFTINPLPYSANFSPVIVDQKEVVVHYKSTRW